jgi:hypothetical protein
MPISAMFQVFHSFHTATDETTETLLAAHDPSIDV